jgi:fermentation-respiration switch protein FrsA (DUF1100 family)
MPSKATMADAPVAAKRLSIKRYLAQMLLIVLALIILGSIGISTFVGWSLTHPERKPIDETPDKYGVSYEDVRFPSQIDQVSLAGWWIPHAQITDASRRPVTVILAHGYAHNRIYRQAGVMSWARILSVKGFNVLMFDFRNAGESGGDITSVGQFEQYDLLGAIDFAKQKAPDAPIILHGFSMGASTSIMAAASSPDVAGVIADSPFDDLTSYLESNLPVWSNLPNIPFTPMIMNIIRLTTELEPEKASPISVISQIGHRPILFIHSSSDHAIPIEHSHRLIEASQNPNAELWSVPGGNHVWARRMFPNEYEKRAFEFLEPFSLK